MITLELVNGSQLVTRFRNLSDRLRGELRNGMNKAVIDLQRHVMEDKLSGQVLKVRTNTLRSSIQKKVEDDAYGVTGVNSTNVKYAAIHEYGGQVRTRLGTGKGPPKKGGKAFIQMPERSFMRSSLRDHRDKIRQDLQDAVARAVKA